MTNTSKYVKYFFRNLMYTASFMMYIKKHLMYIKKLPMKSLLVADLRYILFCLTFLSMKSCRSFLNLFYAGREFYDR
jgi:hypothetical protein